MTTEPIPSLAEAMAEIRRLRATIEHLKHLGDFDHRSTEAAVALAVSRRDGEPSFDAALARIAALEAEIAIVRGTLARPAEDEPPRYEHHVPPSAPPHDE